MHIFKHIKSRVFLTLIAPLLLSSSLCGSEIQTRVINGSQSPSYSHPYTVALIKNRYSPQSSIYCGGTLISPSFVLTAAHCIYNKNRSSIFIAYGNNDLRYSEVVSAKNYYIHPNYNDIKITNDIALIELENSIYLTKYATLQDSFDVGDVGKSALVTGWGLTDYYDTNSFVYQRREVSVPIVDNYTCNKSVSYNGLIDENMICAGYSYGTKDACTGDSGGPLFLDDEQIGIVSFGDGCAKAYKYGVYTKVSNYSNWIRAIATNLPNNQNVKYTKFIKSGWNLLSLPVEKIISYPYREIGYGMIYTYDGYSYTKNPNTISYGEGFWLLSSADYELSMEGRSYVYDSRSIKSGWNLIGSGEKIENISSKYNYNITWVYRDDNWIANPSTIYPFEGFWVKR